ncbi:uncharacterized protein LOC144790640 [Lissotriton helveticus]
MSVSTGSQASVTGSTHLVHDLQSPPDASTVTDPAPPNTSSTLLTSSTSDSEIALDTLTEESLGTITGDVDVSIQTSVRSPTVRSSSHTLAPVPEEDTKTKIKSIHSTTSTLTSPEHETTLSASGASPISRKHVHKSQSHASAVVMVEISQSALVHAKSKNSSSTNSVSIRAAQGHMNETSTSTTVFVPPTLLSRTIDLAHILTTGTTRTAAGMTMTSDSTTTHKDITLVETWFSSNGGPQMRMKMLSASIDEKQNYSTLVPTPLNHEATALHSSYPISSSTVMAGENSPTSDNESMSTMPPMSVSTGSQALVTDPTHLVHTLESPPDASTVTDPAPTNNSSTLLTSSTLDPVIALDTVTEESLSTITGDVDVSIQTSVRSPTVRSSSHTLAPVPEEDTKTKIKSIHSTTSTLTSPEHETTLSASGASPISRKHVHKSQSHASAVVMVEISQSALVHAKSKNSSSTNSVSIRAAQGHMNETSTSTTVFVPPTLLSRTIDLAHILTTGTTRTAAGMTMTSDSTTTHKDITLVETWFSSNGGPQMRMKMLSASIDEKQNYSTLVPTPLNHEATALHSSYPISSSTVMAGENSPTSDNESMSTMPPMSVSTGSQALVTDPTHLVHTLESPPDASTVTDPAPTNNSSTLLTSSTLDPVIALDTVTEESLSTITGDVDVSIQTSVRSPTVRSSSHTLAPVPEEDTKTKIKSIHSTTSTLTSPEHETTLSASGASPISRKHVHKSQSHASAVVMVEISQSALVHAKSKNSSSTNSVSIRAAQGHMNETSTSTTVFVPPTLLSRTIDLAHILTTGTTRTAAGMTMTSDSTTTHKDITLVETWFSSNGGPQMRMKMLSASIDEKQNYSTLVPTPLNHEATALHSSYPISSSTVMAGENSPTSDNESMSTMPPMSVSTGSQALVTDPTHLVHTLESPPDASTVTDPAPTNNSSTLLTSSTLDPVIALDTVTEESLSTITGDVDISATTIILTQTSVRSPTVRNSSHTSTPVPEEATKTKIKSVHSTTSTLTSPKDETTLSASGASPITRKHVHKSQSQASAVVTVEISQSALVHAKSKKSSSTNSASVGAAQGHMNETSTSTTVYEQPTHSSRKIHLSQMLTNATTRTTAGMTMTSDSTTTHQNISLVETWSSSAGGPQMDRQRLSVSTDTKQNYSTLVPTPMKQEATTLHSSDAISSSTVMAGENSPTPDDECMSTTPPMSVSTGSQVSVTGSTQMVHTLQSPPDAPTVTDPAPTNNSSTLLTSSTSDSEIAPDTLTGESLSTITGDIDVSATTMFLTQTSEGSPPVRNSSHTLTPVPEKATNTKIKSVHNTTSTLMHPKDETTLSASGASPITQKHVQKSHSQALAVVTVLMISQSALVHAKPKNSSSTKSTSVGAAQGPINDTSTSTAVYVRPTRSSRKISLAQTLTSATTTTTAGMTMTSDSTTTPKDISLVKTGSSSVGGPKTRRKRLSASTDEKQNHSTLVPTPLKQEATTLHSSYATTRSTALSRKNSPTSTHQSMSTTPPMSASTGRQATVTGSSHSMHALQSPPGATTVTGPAPTNNNSTLLSSSISDSKIPLNAKTEESLSTVTGDAGPTSLPALTSPPRVTSPSSTTAVENSTSVLDKAKTSALASNANRGAVSTQKEASASSLVGRPTSSAAKSSIATETPVTTSQAASESTPSMSAAASQEDVDNTASTESAHGQPALLIMAPDVTIKTLTAITSATEENYIILVDNFSTAKVDIFSDTTPSSVTSVWMTEIVSSRATKVKRRFDFRNVTTLVPQQVAAVHTSTAGTRPSGDSLQRLPGSDSATHPNNSTDKSAGQTKSASNSTIADTARTKHSSSTIAYTAWPKNSSSTIADKASPRNAMSTFAAATGGEAGHSAAGQCGLSTCPLEYCTNGGMCQLVPPECTPACKCTSESQRSPCTVAGNTFIPQPFKAIPTRQVDIKLTMIGEALSDAVHRGKNSYLALQNSINATVSQILRNLPLSVFNKISAIRFMTLEGKEVAFVTSDFIYENSHNVINFLNENLGTSIVNTFNKAPPQKRRLMNIALAPLSRDDITTRRILYKEDLKKYFICSLYGYSGYLLEYTSVGFVCTSPCESDYCQNDGVCKHDESGPTCRCVPYAIYTPYGEKCQNLGVTLSAFYGILFGVLVFLLLLLVCLCLVAYCCWRRRQGAHPADKHQLKETPGNIRCAQFRWHSELQCIGKPSPSNNAAFRTRCASEDKMTQVYSDKELEENIWGIWDYTQPQQQPGTSHQSQVVSGSAQTHEDKTIQLKPGKSQQSQVVSGSEDTHEDKTIQDSTQSRSSMLKAGKSHQSQVVFESGHADEDKTIQLEPGKSQQSQVVCEPGRTDENKTIEVSTRSRSSILKPGKSQQSQVVSESEHTDEDKTIQLQPEKSQQSQVVSESEHTLEGKTIQLQPGKSQQSQVVSGSAHTNENKTIKVSTWSKSSILHPGKSQQSQVVSGSEHTHEGKTSQVSTRSRSSILKPGKSQQSQVVSGSGHTLEDKTIQISSRSRSSMVKTHRL